MKEYKNLYNKLYKLEGINYSGVSLDNRKFDSLSGKTKEASSFFRSLNGNELFEVLEVGASVGHASAHFPNYRGIEYSKTVVEIGKSIYGEDTKLIQADARKLPFNNSSIDFVFSINVLEHIPEPQLALEEFIRVARLESYIYLDPAYNCRRFTVKKLESRNYSDLLFVDKLEKFFIPVLNNIVFRLISSIPRRLYLEILLLASDNPIKFHHKNLYPNFELIEKLGHNSDDDAFSNFDKHSIIIYFASRKYKVIGYESLIKRLLCRTGPVIVKL